MSTNYNVPVGGSCGGEDNGGGGGAGSVTIVNNNFYGGGCPVPPTEPCVFSRAIIFDRTPGIPYEKSARVPSQATPFKVTVEGTCAARPLQFVINICDEVGNILLHFNPRWTETRTVLNANLIGCGWGQEQYAFFKSLYANAKFKIDITFDNQQFIVKVNSEAAVCFTSRRSFCGTLRKVQVCNDVHLSCVQLLY